MRNTELSFRAAVAASAAAAVIVTLISACSAEPSGSALWERVPVVNGAEEDPVIDVTDLVSRAELVIIGNVTDVEITASKPKAPAGDEAPGFLLVDLKTTLYVTPVGEKSPIPISISSSIAADLADATVAAIEKAPLPTATTIFVLSGPVDDWGYYCTSALAYWCPLEVTGGALHAPRSDYWDEVLARDATSANGDPVKAVVAVARAYDVEVRGA